MMDIYKAEYIGQLKVERKVNGYLITLGMQIPEKPISIYAELEGDALLKFIKNELQHRDLSPYNYSGIQLTYPASCNNQIRKCCEKSRTNR